MSYKEKKYKTPNGFKTDDDGSMTIVREAQPVLDDGSKDVPEARPAYEEKPAEDRHVYQPTPLEKELEKDIQRTALEIKVENINEKTTPLENGVPSDKKPSRGGIPNNDPYQEDYDFTAMETPQGLEIKEMKKDRPVRYPRSKRDKKRYNGPDVKLN